MSNSLTYCDLPAEISQWPGLPLSLSGDEVMPLDYRAGNTGWLLYGRKLDKARITQFQRKLGAAMVIVAAWCVEDYQVMRLAGSLTPRATLSGAGGRAGRRAAGQNPAPANAGPAGDGHGLDRHPDRVYRRDCEAGGRRRAGGGSHRARDARRAGLHRQPAPARGDAERGRCQHPAGRCATCCR